MILLIDSGLHVSDTPFKEIVRNKSPRLYFGGFSCLEALLPSGEFTIVIAPENDIQEGEYELEVSQIGCKQFNYSKPIIMEELTLET